MQSHETLPTPWPSQDGETAKLALDLMERYQTVADSLKVLREQMQVNRKFGQFSIPAEQVEMHRTLATGLFNHLCRLLQARLISGDLFILIISPRAARLWLENVAPLDYVIREKAADMEGTETVPFGETVIEQFYKHYAETGELILAIRTPVPDVPAGATH